eukprot:3341759-Pleurochrysis_carterae.AAC.1
MRDERGGWRAGGGGGQQCGVSWRCGAPASPVKAAKRPVRSAIECVCLFVYMRPCESGTQRRD